MTKHRSKNALIEAIQVEHLRLEKSLALISTRDMVEQGAVGTWSVKDVLAHLTAWEQLLLNWYDAGLFGKTPSPPLPTGMSKNAIDKLNQDIFEQNRKRPLASVLNEFQTSYQQVLVTMLMVQEEDMFTPGRYAWTGRLMLADYITSNTCNH
ncbi:MAG: ClbS/DfsB family four-helix bundle protein [Chloroflexota bacterium]